jgi:7-cyano-7-deazaguanine synthase in queuosine biosynthesis
VTGEPTVHCEVEGLRAAYGSQCIEFNIGSDLIMRAEGEFGRHGVSPAAADLVDLGAAIYQIERQLRGRQRTNPAARFDLQISLRDPLPWTAPARATLTAILADLGNAEWNVEVHQRRDAQVEEHRCQAGREVDRVVLLSGGLDSASGAATGTGNASGTCLVSFYTRQKTRQQEIAAKLGYQPPAQWRMSWQRPGGRGHTFRYRSFFFLCLAAAVADSWGARRILQYENGVLATSIPPGPSWFMTRHAHPVMQERMARLAGAILGGTWTVENPFLQLTKRQGLEAARHAAGASVMNEVAARTETCWFHWSNRMVGGSKPPGVPCGVCIPCIVRRTALPSGAWARDLRDDTVKNHPDLGRAFRAYYGFLRDVRGTGRSPGEFYRVLPVAGRELHTRGVVTLQELHDLFRRFADEFMETFQL